MKHFKRMLAVALTMFLAFVVSATAFAAPLASDGSITVTNAESGKDYTLYKLFDMESQDPATGNAIWTLPTGKTIADPADDWFEVDADGIHVSPKAEFNETVLKSEEFKTWALSFGTKIGDTKTATSDSVTWENLDYGYYFIDTATGAAVTVDTVNSDVEVIDKNQKVESAKWIIEGGKKVKLNEAYINEPVNFLLSVSTKNYELTDKIFRYVVKDQAAAGFTITTEPVVMVGGEVLTKGEDYTIKYFVGTTEQNAFAGADHFEVTIPWTDNNAVEGDHLYTNGAELEVTFTAILDPAKADKVVYWPTANENVLNVDFYKGNDEPDKPSGHTPEDKTKTYDTQLKLIKVDENERPMTGAAFKLTSTNNKEVTYVFGSEFVKDAAGTYYLLKDGSYTDEAPTGDAYHDAPYASTTDKYVLNTFTRVMGGLAEPTNVESFVGADGTITFKGLSAGDYTLTETVVPAGYSKAEDIEFTISFDPGEAGDGSDCTFESDNIKVVLNETTNMFETTIKNVPGTPLPSTGGMGTTILYVVGGIMMLAGAVMFFTKRRVASMEN